MSKRVQRVQAMRRHKGPEPEPKPKNDAAATQRGQGREAASLSEEACAVRTRQASDSQWDTSSGESSVYLLTSDDREQKFPSEASVIRAAKKLIKEGWPGQGVDDILNRPDVAVDVLTHGAPEEQTALAVAARVKRTDGHLEILFLHVPKCSQGNNLGARCILLMLQKIKEKRPRACAAAAACIFAHAEESAVEYWRRLGFEHCDDASGQHGCTGQEHFKGTVLLKLESHDADKHFRRPVGIRSRLATHAYQGKTHANTATPDKRGRRKEILVLRLDRRPRPETFGVESACLCALCSRCRSCPRGREGPSMADVQLVMYVHTGQLAHVHTSDLSAAPDEEVSKSDPTELRRKEQECVANARVATSPRSPSRKRQRGVRRRLVEGDSHCSGSSCDTRRSLTPSFDARAWSRPSPEQEARADEAMLQAKAVGFLGWLRERRRALASLKALATPLHLSHPIATCC